LVLKGVFPWGKVLLESVQKDFFLKRNIVQIGERWKREEGLQNANCLDHERDVLHFG
jgi:hypothetical protein